MKTILHMQDVVHRYRDGDEARTVLSGLSLQVGAGELVAVMGPSGSGKSTFLSIAGALLTPGSGVVTIDGTPLSGLDTRALADLRLSKIGFIFQSANLIPYLKVDEQLRLVSKLSHADAAGAARRSDMLLERLGIRSRRRQYPDRLSGGERQRVAIARAWMNDPPLLLADEPTASLDEERGAEVVRMLAEGARTDGKAAVMVTHDSRVLELCDRVLKLQDGVLAPA
ncbi:ABC transporter ATP-binding protein [Cohnella sp. 56]|uniref:ABC transporter ATP-binding protein n=1 Tax=Cohnella sp. 56 TaxID=3113722 RepID=UPI0030EA6F10